MARVALKSEASAFKKLVFIRVDSWLVEAPMKIRITSDVRSIAVAAALPWLVAVMPAVATTPQYQIYDIGVIDAGDTASQGFGVSHAGIAVGRSIRTDGSQAFIWTLDYGIIGLPNLAGRSFAAPGGVKRVKRQVFTLEYSARGEYVKSVSLHPARNPAHRG